MSSMLKPPPAALPSSPQRHRFTVAEFNHMGDLGWFEGRRAFLLDGIILENGPMDPPHAVVVGLVHQGLQSIFTAGYWVRGQMPLNLDEFNYPLPDLAVVRGTPRDYSGVHPSTAELVVEVADTSLQIDITEKAERYATAGIADYWVLDIAGQQLHVFRDPAPLPAGLGATAYRTHLTVKPTERIAPLAVPHAMLLVGDLLP